MFLGSIGILVKIPLSSGIHGWLLILATAHDALSAHHASGYAVLSIKYISLALYIVLRSAFLFVSLALHCTAWSLGTRAAAKIPIITMTISISINVNQLLF